MFFLKRQNGASLLEVLVAIVVLSLGLLGLAGLQVASLQLNQGALQRSQATLLAYDILDRMRANKVDALAGDYEIATGASASGSTVPDLDLADWKAALVRALGPGADGFVCRRSNSTDATEAACTGSGNFFVVGIRWTEADLSASDGVVKGRVTQNVAIVGRIK